MKTPIRKVLILVLALVLVCCLAAVAFAVPSIDVEEGFFGFYMHAVAEVDQYSTDLDLYAEPASAVYSIVGDVNVQYSFEWMQPIEGHPYGEYSASLTVNESDGDYYYHKRLYPSQHNILRMRYAAYAIDVDIASSRGTVNFAPNTIYVTYPD